MWVATMVLTMVGSMAVQKVVLKAGKWVAMMAGKMAVMTVAMLVG